MKKKKGYTLLEIVVALAIIGIMMIPLANSLLTSVKTNKKAEIKQESKLISQEIIEKLRTIGDVKETTMTVGRNNDNVTISDISPVADKKNLFKIEGVVNGITLKGEISKNDVHREIIDSSDKIATEKVALVITLDESSDGKGILNYSYDPSGIATIDQHINSNVTTKGTLTLKDTIGILFEKNNAGNRICKIIDFNGSTNTSKEIIITEAIDGSNISNKPIKFAIYNKVPRDGTDKKPYVELDLKNKMDLERINVYFLNNKFEVDKDSFQKNKYISESIDIFENIKYIAESDRKNKGLYTLNLTTQKKGNIESTRTEFIVIK